MSVFDMSNTTDLQKSPCEPEFFSQVLFKYTFNDIAPKFNEYHQEPVNVLMHLITTPLGMIGALSLLRWVTRSSSMGVFVFFLYLVSLLPALSIGIFLGTLFLCFLIVEVTRKLKLSPLPSIVLIISSYALQDLVHLATGEPTFQGSYSAGGHIDLTDPVSWSKLFFEHVYYLLPLVVNSAMMLPVVQGILPDAFTSVLVSPLPEPLQQLRICAKYLLPLSCVAYGSYCLDSKNSLCFFPGTPYFHRVLQCNMVTDAGKSMKGALSAVRNWTMAQNPSPSSSSHWWYGDLSGKEKDAFDECANCTQITNMFRELFSERHYAMDIVTGMNEIYVTGPSRFDQVSNSDNVFYTRHVDGPLGFIPFVSVYRCIVGMDKNEMVTTHFPLSGVDQNACEGDVLAFDFNREVHYITRDDSKQAESDDFRVVLKLHYCLYPRIMYPLGKLMHFLNVKYNQLFRALFLTTINPQSAYQHFLAWNVNSNTKLFDALETYVGARSLIYLALVSAVSYFTGVYNVFFACTSFVHYMRYITTFYVRRGIDFGSFKRDVLLFKSIALAQLFYHYFVGPFFASTFQIDFISLAMIISGYTVSVMATNALGLDRTYFAAELGLVKPKWVDQFPYGYIPHPMIVSQIWALLGFMKADHFRTEWPYVIPIHVTFYVIHMLQEQFDIYRRYPDEVGVASSTSQKQEYYRSHAALAKDISSTQRRRRGTSSSRQLVKK